MSDPFDTPADLSATPEPPPAHFGLDLTRVRPEALDEQQHVAVELPCRTCGYDLRTMHVGAGCPECGESVYHSLVGDLLRFADADWLTTVARGTAWSLVTLVGSFALGTVIGVLTEVVAVDSPAFLIASVIFGAAITVVYGLAIFWMTEPEPRSRVRPAVSDGLRRWARLLLMISVAFGLLGVAAEVADVLIPDLLTTTVTLNQPPVTNPPPGSGPTVINAPFTYDQQTTLGMIWIGASILFQLLGLVGLFCLAMHFRQLALRAPAIGLAKQTKALVTIWIAVLLIGLFIGLAAYVALNANNPPYVGPFVPIVLGCGGGIILLGLAIWALVVQILYYLLFKRQAGFARENAQGRLPTR